MLPICYLLRRYQHFPTLIVFYIQYSLFSRKVFCHFFRIFHSLLLFIILVHLLQFLNVKNVHTHLYTYRTECTNMMKCRINFFESEITQPFNPKKRSRSFSRSFFFLSEPCGFVMWRNNVIIAAFLQPRSRSRRRSFLN